MSACFLLGALLQANSQPALANNSFLFSQGIGFTDVNNGAWVDVYIHDTSPSRYNEAVQAIDSWRALRVTPSRWWLRHTTNPAEAEIEVMDKGAISIFAEPYRTEHVNRCNDTPAGAYARSVVTDDSTVTWRGWVSGQWATKPGWPFKRATACLNPAWTIDQGHIAHELGHALGLNHITTDSGGCSDTGRNSIMAYNYTNRTVQWPAYPLTAENIPKEVPQSADIFGPWVCNANNAGGLAYVYQVSPGTGSPSSGDTDGDRCADREETAGNHLFGGERNPADRYDYFDVNGDARVDLADTSLITAHFGHGPFHDFADVLMDRHVLDQVDHESGKTWRTDWAGDGVDLTDALVNLEAFGHDCSGPP